MKDRIAAQIQGSITVSQALIDSFLPLIEQAAGEVTRALKNGKKILFFGNGGSASDSQHLAAEFVGRYEKERKALPAIALTTDTSILTAVGNDYGYEHVFERQVAALAQPGDVAFAISTSGNSPSVLLAIQKAKAMGVYVIGFTGRDGGKMKSMVDLPVVIPAQKTSRIQEAHIMIGHIICECVDESFAV